ncbi:MAG TPA: Asp23/Gls24 family envelope stress response protein [bacterium]|nr:Asp23/Gls24 family envelope stress response protein [bacterium]
MYSFFSDLQWKIKFKLIEVYGLYGTSGTGKSHNAFNIMDKYDINVIIDDGIIIHHGSIIAGRSAKKAPTRMEAVRRAIFFDDSHKQEIEDAVKSINPSKILIIGTSEKMISKIVVRLGLAQPAKLINIFDIVSPKDIERARYYRYVENKHVIPVPAIQIGKTFPGGLVDYIDQFLSKKKVREKSIVRPSYNSIGNIVVSRNVIVYYLKNFFSKFQRGELKHFQLSYNKVALDLGIKIKLYLSVKYGENIKEISAIIQKNLKNYIEFFIGLEVNKIDVNIIEILKNT